jgi:hypothetical protein
VKVSALALAFALPRDLALAVFLGAASATETVPASSAATIHASPSLRGADDPLVNIRDIRIFYPFLPAGD